MFLEIYFLYQFHHLPIVYSNFSSIDGLIYLLGQSPHDLIMVSGNALMDTDRGVFTNLLYVSQSNQVVDQD
jgi:hypothetical protein